MQTLRHFTRAAVAVALLALTACGAEPPRPAPHPTPVAASAPVARAPIKRNLAARRAFQRANPCPENGKARGACPGWVVDHIEPLCAGGADTPENMQWQRREDSHRKDAQERRHCAAIRAFEAP